MFFLLLAFLLQGCFALHIYVVSRLMRLQGQLMQLATWGYMSGKFHNLLLVCLDTGLEMSRAVIALTAFLAEALLGLILVGLCLRKRTLYLFKCLCSCCANLRISRLVDHKADNG